MSCCFCVVVFSDVRITVYRGTTPPTPTRHRLTSPVPNNTPQPLCGRCVEGSSPGTNGSSLHSGYHGPEGHTKTLQSSYFRYAKTIYRNKNLQLLIVKKFRICVDIHLKTDVATQCEGCNTRKLGVKLTLKEY